MTTAAPRTHWRIEQPEVTTRLVVAAHLDRF